MTDLYVTDFENKIPLYDYTSTKVSSKEDTSKENEKDEMINKISENLYILESILQEKENEGILRSLYNMLQKKTEEKASEEEQCSIQ